jgi:hypothetical protein
MAIGPQIAQSGPAIVVTLRCGTIVLWVDHLMLTPARGAPQWRRTGRALRGRRWGVLTGGTAGLGAETRKRLRVLQMLCGAFGGLGVSCAGGGLAPLATPRAASYRATVSSAGERQAAGRASSLVPPSRSVQRRYTTWLSGMAINHTTTFIR